MGEDRNLKGNRNDSNVEHEEDYAFLQETFKDEKGRARFRKSKAVKCAGLGLLFGIAASLGFFVLKPLAHNLANDNPGQVMIPDEELAEAGEAKEESSKLEDYREMNDALNEIGKEAMRSMVLIAVSGKDDALKKAEGQGTVGVSGIIIADNGPEYLILASSSVAKDGEKLKAKFVDGRTCEAKLKKKDETLDGAVYAVSKNKLSKDTRAAVAIAELGMFGSVEQGDPIIAIGSPFGYEEAMGFGVVASVKNTIKHPDGDYRLICTDITGVENGTGALVNIDGKVVGIIDPVVAAHESEDSSNLVMAYGISDLKQRIEILSNGKSVPYLGITGVEVTDEIAAEQEIPRGIYVQEVQPESPAMAAGIQSGDVLTAIGEESMETQQSYQSILLKREIGSSLTINGMRKGSDGYVEITYNVKVGVCE